MTKSEFMKELTESLALRGVENPKEILQDYEEHFAHALQSGKSENEICQRLGSPKTIALAFETKSLLSHTQSNNGKFQSQLILKALGRLLLLAPFTILVLFIPGILLFSYLVTGWSLVGAAALGSLFILGLSFSGGILTFSFWVFFTLISAAFAGFGIVVAAFIFMFVTTKALVRMVVDYIKWNLNFILDKRKEV